MSVHSNPSMSLNRAVVGQVLLFPQCRVMHGAAARPFEAGGERPGV
jgi:hypothetical protein